ncbi:hypothetical protein ACQPW1_13055 [Nocardia sp. CA-128927]|uniref:hypothetical protein n=1 Tax=Nocardia sp. CA-128927 TaxID=3239975 RepID=UPI003D966CB9
MDDSVRRVVAARDSVLPLIPRPWHRGQFLDALSKVRGRPIHLVPLPSDSVAAGHGTLSGVWLNCGDSDVIAYDARTTEYHADQIIAHEIGHMLLDHAVAGAGSVGGRRLLPNIDPAVVGRVLGRTDLQSCQEDEAELFANLLLLEATRRRSLRALWGSCSITWRQAVLGARG